MGFVDVVELSKVSDTFLDYPPKNSRKNIATEPRFEWKSAGASVSWTIHSNVCFWMAIK